jgi:hypothetical protein
MEPSHYIRTKLTSGIITVPAGDTNFNLNTSKLTSGDCGLWRHIGIWRARIAAPQSVSTIRVDIVQPTQTVPTPYTETYYLVDSGRDSQLTPVTPSGVPTVNEWLNHPPSPIWLDRSATSFRFTLDQQVVDVSLYLDLDVFIGEPTILL